MDRLLRTFLDALPIPIVGVDREGLVVVWSVGAERLLGWSASEVMGKALPVVPPDLVEQYEALRAHVLRGGCERYFETRRRRKDGTDLDVVIATAVARDSSGSLEASFAVYHDLTEIREAQRRVSLAEQRYRSLLETALDIAVLVLALDGTIIDCNRGAEQMLGAAGESPDGAKFMAGSPAEAQRELAAARDAGTFTREHWYPRGDGSRFWAEISITAIRDSAGAVADYIAVIRDMTERKKAQDQLHERSVQSEAVAAFAHLAIGERDRENLARTVVEHVAAALGADRAELLSVSADGTLEVTHDCRGHSHAGVRVSLGSSAIQAEAVSKTAMRRALETRDYHAAPHLRSFKYGAATAVVSGDSVYVLAAYSADHAFDGQSMYPLQAIGAMYAAAVARGAAEDQLADGQCRLRLVLEQIPAIVSTLDRNLTFTSTQGSGLTALDLTAGGLVGQTLFDIGGSEDSALVQSARAALRGEARRFEWTFQGRTFENRVEPLRDREGEVAGVINLGLDITEHRQAEAALIDSRRQLRRLSAAMHRVQEDERRRIAREVHDELGQRLTALRLDLGLLRNELRGDRREEAEERMGTMLGLIDETIGTVRRVATELRPAILDDFGFRAAVENELNTLQHRTGIRTSLSIVPDDLSIESARATALYRIVQEAITNVARHSGAKRVDVRIEARDGKIEAELRDDGRGISPAQLHNVSTLGLLGMRERAYALGGEAVFEGSEGRGTRVFVTIPNEDSDRR